ncbi:tyrosine-type recombinase/integrase [Bifidobacterium sp. ESL0728]|uniref:tyrosine-type recombinase/integrase n=1 Tax=Bifidobacterium sp. ESL0728 TaxID=2983220 RepID=UPI0023F93348|nr:site-specific integrase [Bifidobacterium sp. ESL0728]WEV58276.1 tyrosine-type recombinase/integrase [Bifidobacterium sp. ESL0728]
MAQAWLDGEQDYLEHCQRDHEQWLPPKERERLLERDEVLFSDYAAQFLESYRAADGSQLTEASMRKKREAVAHLTGFFDGMKLSDITEGDVNVWLDGYNDGVHSQRHAYQTLKEIFAKAVREGIVEKSPCTRPNPKLPKSKQSDIPAATQEELELIYRAMPDYCRIVVYLGAVFGLRISEVCALQRRDFDFKRGVLHVRHSLSRGKGDVGELRLKGTKTESSNADLPIPDGFVPMLRQHMTELRDKAPEAMVVPSRGGGIMNPNTLRGIFDGARKAAGRPDLHFHTLRATAITTAAVVGGTPKKVQQYGRHADAEISLQLYQRAADRGEKRLADKVFDSLVAPERTPKFVRTELATARKRLQDARDRVQRLEDELEALESEKWRRKPVKATGTAPRA